MELPLLISRSRHVQPFNPFPNAQIPETGSILETKVFQALFGASLNSYTRDGNVITDEAIDSVPDKVASKEIKDLLKEIKKTKGSTFEDLLRGIPDAFKTLEDMNSCAFVNVDHDSFFVSPCEVRLALANARLMTAFPFAIAPVYTPERDPSTNAGSPPRMTF